MEPASTNALNSGMTDLCMSQMAGKSRLRRVRATPAESEALLTREAVSTSKSAAGLVLLESSLRPMWFNREAVQILSYPETAASLRRAKFSLTEAIRSRLTITSPAGESVFVKELRSGRRRYSCRAFPIDLHAEELCQPVTVAVLLERAPSGPVPLSQVCQQFNLTQREQEVLAHLLQGVRNKEIAVRMNISSNTVRAFLRVIMIKTRVSSRSAIIGKILTAQRSTEVSPGVQPRETFTPLLQADDPKAILLSSGHARTESPEIPASIKQRRPHSG